ncbi:MAG: hypothetical protein Q9217_005825 [Psora testacea]
MYTPTYVQLKYWYYPVGYTPAVNLVRDLPCVGGSKKNTNILSLACGDPRNVLFTLWCEQRSVTSCSFSFSCCDIEPAVLARNVVLYTFIIDAFAKDECNDPPHLTLWNLFYHFYITEQNLSTLRCHIARLLKVSGSYNAWTSSSYGDSIKFIDQATLAHLRRYWIRYAATGEEEHVQKRNAQARSAIVCRSREIGSTGILNGARAAGPLLFSALLAVPDIYRKFWKSGVAGGNAQDIASLGGRGIINPLFAASSAPSREFAVHYGTEPLVNFHVAEAFYDKVPSREAIAEAEEVVIVAKTQFRDWCNNFETFVRSGKVVMRFFFGDALALGHALQLQPLESGTGKSISRSYRKAWSSDPLLIDGDCPEQPFDVIDTSNLGDHVGLINMISATASLLHRDATAVLYTESLLMATEDIAASLTTLLGSDVTTFSLLTGLAPSGLLSSVTLEAVGNEAAMFATAQRDRDLRQYRMRLAWKHIESEDLAAEPNSQTQVSFEPKMLAAYLWSIYKWMFVNEDLTKITERTLRMQKGQYSIDQARYTRAGMVALLRLVKARVKVDWAKFMPVFLHNVESDRRLIVGSNSLQELHMHLHTFGVWTSDALSKDPRQLAGDISLGLRPKNADKGLLALDRLPSIAHLVLLVPRHKLEVFTKKDQDEVGTPALHVSVSQAYGSSQFENSFYSFQSFFGKVKYNSPTFEITEVEEDENGWLGTQDLVVITAVPTFGLLVGPRDGLSIALKINTNPDAVMRYSSLGPLMKVYETGLKDDRRCFVCHNAPRLSTSGWQISQKEWVQAAISANRRPSYSLVTLDHTHKAAHLQNHIDFPRDSVEGKALASGAPVSVKHTSPSVITASIGTRVRHTISYPFPIQGSKAKTRIARKSSWIEVEGPIATAHDADPFDSWTQMAIRVDGAPICKDIPRVDLTIQPVIPVSKGIEVDWLPLFLGPTLSDTESAINSSAIDNPTSGSVKVDFKQSINTLFSSFAGSNATWNSHNSGKRWQTFQLSINQSCHTILFATALHQDLDLSSIVLEAFVLPLTIPKVMAMGQALYNLQEAAQPCGIHVTSAETVLWKRLLPALAERCRTYPHKPSCEYRRPGAKIPLSVEEAENPLCSCGEGQISGSEFAQMGGGLSAWKPFAKHVTRIAISPIFPVPFVENSMSDIRKRMHPSFASGTGGKAAASMESLLVGGGGQVSAGDASKCDHCGKGGGSLKTCGRCGRVRYCGGVCQKAAWREHKKGCERA